MPSKGYPDLPKSLNQGIYFILRILIVIKESTLIYTKGPYYELRYIP